MELEITINKYINGELSGSALEEFKAQLRNDKSLQEEIQFHREVDEALCINEEVENNSNLKTLLRNLGKTHIQNENEKISNPVEENRSREIIANPEIFPENRGRLKKLNPFILLAVAAAFLLFMFLPSLQNQSNSQIADNFFQVYQFNDNVLGGDSGEDLLKKANENYADGNWKESISQFNQYLLENPNALKVLLTTGSAEFKLAEFNAAIESFNRVLKADDSQIYQPIANWYLALCYLKKDDKSNAIKHLKVIEKGQDHFEEAQQLLKLL